MITLSAAGATGLTLPNAELNNKVAVDLRTRFKYANDGTVYTYRATPAIRTMELTISGMSYMEVQDLFTFIDVAAAHAPNNPITLGWGSESLVGFFLISEFTDTVSRRSWGHSVTLPFTLAIS